MLPLTLTMAMNSPRTGLMTVGAFGETALVGSQVVNRSGNSNGQLLAMLLEATVVITVRSLAPTP